MTRPRELRVNAFNMTAPSHNWAGLWSHPRGEHEINGTPLPAKSFS
ncbi:hypothetical protein [Bradyrhizobium cytisi]|nr:hypothetical protein [Bradyrhizobium cytisi]